MSSTRFNINLQFVIGSRGNILALYQRSMVLFLKYVTLCHDPYWYVYTAKPDGRQKKTKGNNIKGFVEIVILRYNH